MCIRPVIRTATANVVIGLSVMLVGCDRDFATIWSQEVKSPDGHWVAVASTTQNGGPGTASVDTAVYLKWLASSGSPTLILGLSNESAYPLGITRVRMSWLTDKHLDLAYCEGTVGFQAIKAGGSLDISVHKLTDAECSEGNAEKKG